MTIAVSLDDKYTAEEGRVFLTGIQALVRLPMTQMRRDRAAGLNTGAFISGYRGSPLGGLDQQIWAARKFLDPLDIHFQPGINEDLAATAVWGSQQVPLSKGARKQGVVGMWYGKGPGVDRSGDVFKHANAAGTSQYGGVLAVAGDDHTCKSSSIPHQSDHAFISAIMPVLYPSSVHEFLPLGLLGIAMSRFSGCWVGFKVISETVETTAVVDLAPEKRQFVIPEDFELPPGGLNLRWPDPPLVQDERLQEYKGYAARAFARANRLDEVTFDTPRARFGIVASGKAYEDVDQALHELGLGERELHQIGVRIYKVRMPWPLEPEGIRHFSEGLEEVLIVEERREIIEHQIKQQLFNWRADVRPRIVGKFDHMDRPFLHLSAGLTVAEVARAIVDRLVANGIPDDLKARITERVERLEGIERAMTGHQPPVIRRPWYCAGCPHNTSTRVVEGSTAMAGIGCHYMVQWMDRNTDTITHMGGEGVPWTAISRFTDEPHRFVNLGDGTFYHSGLLAIRQSVAAGTPITYKLLYNDAVAMTGGQHVDGPLTPERVAHMLRDEGVQEIRFLAETPEAYKPEALPPGTVIRHRDAIDDTMRELREIKGVTAIVFVQTCAAEKRRRRKRGTLPDPDMRLWISPEVCEGCGDCSVQSNCVAVEPLETEMGRKRRINQSTCNKDYSCLKGFCPSFVTVRGGQPRKLAAADRPDTSHLAEPQRPVLDRPWNVAVAGVGGTGVLTIGAILAMASHMDGLSPMVLDMAGLAQKGGAVLSHIRIGPADHAPTEPRIVTGGADVLLAADTVVAVSKEAAVLCNPERTAGVVNTHMTPVSDFVLHRDFDFRTREVEGMLAGHLRERHFHDFTAAGLAVAGDEIASNILMLGYAWQKGLIPVSHDSIEQAIRLNKVAVDTNLDAFAWGRVMADDPARLPKLEAPRRSMEDMTTEELVVQRKAHLAAYQNSRLASRYAALVARVETATVGLSDKETARKIVRSVAHGYARVLAPKDEYEVARLLTAPEFRKGLEDSFDGNMKLSLNLAPPFLAKPGPTGRPVKHEFGPWLFPVLRTLARLKSLRGSAFDPFGHTAERRAERALIPDYEADVAKVLALLDDRTAPKALALLDLYNQIRGFGPVKDAAMAQAAERRTKLLADLDRGAEPPAGHALAAE
ncbi:Indolepyruvate ferredoxin oxidoreductase, alpha and beta subunit [Rubellimicrobium mesophilum DSM 19309]|uniref:Indolepyruvate ferredoxin oxidoreductase, alpha and beta subunit n=1 Tax=Rubellimicrobium mesophilum DSM 19309 TaxID=442562 RepID=A0A017HK48_9RHOB|nr:indolepyruvate ferredoxin oxidoreductase family protein [Rubellimicrobium mesophilum]EYD74877.1 Indolepyruvate ferredoxin oxidoreductase, alpha and beta subunit [Rubellimicrobium mesophilum DSM 19309]